MNTELRVGDQVIYAGRQYWLRMIITLNTGEEMLLIYQAHWKDGFHKLVKKSDVLVDTPFTA